MLIVKREFGFERTYRSRSIPHPYEIGEHIHQHVEILIALSGETALTVDGKNYMLTKGQIGVIMPFSAHSIRTVGTDTRFWLIVFSSSVLPGAREDRTLLLKRSSPCFAAPEYLLEYVTGTVDINDTGYTHIAGEIPRRVSSMLYAVLTEYTNAVPDAEQRENDSALSRLILYITEHYREQISRESVGKALGYNPRYLSQVLSQLPGMSFRTLLNSCRADLARSLLLSTDMRVIDIAYECGYTEERTFRRAFRSVVGMSPCDYRSARKAQ
jgi:AraC-like DNA-binding protein/quercetin dioxygenase-like cupin family protein